MRTNKHGIIRLIAIAGLLAFGISSAYAGGRRNPSTPPPPPVVNEDLPVVSAP